MRVNETRRWTRGAAAAVALALAAWPAGGGATTQRAFSAGALLIPAQQEYQTDCGMTSAYGLVYALLYENETRIAENKKPITIYWVIDPRKKSHHRCDTESTALPDYTNFNDNDGCDLAIQSDDGQPVALLNPDGTEEAPFSVAKSQYDSAKGESRRSGGTQEINASTKVVKYSGGLWVIDASDRDAVIAIMKSDPLVNRFRNGCDTCRTLPAPPSDPATNSFACHFTNVHSARIGFTAPVARIMSKKPPLIGLIDGGNLQILQDYLQNSGLDMIAGAGGTFDQHGIVYDSLDPVTDMVSTSIPLTGFTSTYFPKTTGGVPDPKSSRVDYSKGAINATKADGTSVYYVLWAPHWELLKSTAPVDGAKGDDVAGDGQWTHNGESAWDNARKNLSLFGATGNGIYAQCAAIESLEGSYKTSIGSCACQDAMGNPATLTCPAGFTLPEVANTTCSTCYQCPAGQVPVGLTCNEVKCVPAAAVDRCAATHRWVPEFVGCYDCNAACVNTGTKRVPVLTCSADENIVVVPQSTSPMCAFPAAAPPLQPVPAIAGTMISSAPSAQEQLACVAPNTCVAASGDVDVPGSQHTHFHTTNAISKNGLGNSFFNAPDCTDELVVTVSSKYKANSITGDCFDFHPDQGGPGNVYAQKGNFNYDGSAGSVHQYKPPASMSSAYYEDVQRFATFRNESDSGRDGWDFATARHMDGDPANGMIVYLAGHKYQADAVGNRIALNTLLNLGQSDPGVEIARSEPVGYVTRSVDSTTGLLAATKEQVFQGTYVQVAPPLGGADDWVSYNPVSPQSWKFPYIAGHLRAYPVGSVATTQRQDFSANAEWDAADEMPPPGSRKIYTALGGAGPAGWKRIAWDRREADPSLSCTTSGNDANGQPICDLSRAIAACGATPGPGVSLATLQAGANPAAMKKSIGRFVQQVRGFCAARSSTAGDAFYEPVDDQCWSLRQQDNRSKLGGIDHSSPAVVGPSRYMRDVTVGATTTRWSKRPVVAYAGGRDGMLHAVYVSGVETASWTADGATLAAEPTTAPGQELWAFIPPGQICGLASNSAMVDATINVIDVFGDFPRDRNGNGVIDVGLTGTDSEAATGIREWRTVLLATTGGDANGNGTRRSEVFAMDVTNPLKPVLLWHVDGKEQDDDAGMVTTDAATYAMKWFDWDDGSTTTEHIPTKFERSTAAALTAQKSGRYNYGNLGYSLGTAVGLLWEGNAYRYVLYVTTNAADWTTGTPLGFKGVETFAMDVITGKKLWQWEKLYRRKNAAGTTMADNELPGRPALVDTDSDGSIDRVYVGDMEGRLWELSARTGVNLNYLPASDGEFHSFPLFGADPMTGAGSAAVGEADAATKALFRPSGSTALALQPLTSPIGVGRLTAVPTEPQDLTPYLKNRVAVTQGTMGIGWPIAPYERGHVYVVPVFPEVGTRLDVPVNIGAVPDPRLRGVVKPEAYWTITMNVGERVFGMPKIVGNDVFVNTAYGAFTGDISASYLDAGSTYKVTASGAQEVMAAGKAFGGVLVVGNDVVISSAAGLERKENKATPPPGNAPATRVRNRTTPTFLNTWEQFPPVDAPYLEVQ